ncbi:MAG: NAD(P)H-dependent oxidoreductase [Sphingobium sp.]|nr:NAD(P)H-dependent oxidoreductase [Sphingobium sp.]
MPLSLLVFYGSYREHRAGIRLANYCLAQLAAREHAVELIDAREVGLPMLDRRYMDYGPGEAPDNMEALAQKLLAADGYVFVAGEYNWGMQPGLKNLVDHYGKEYYRTPAGILTYSAGRMAGARSNSAWHPTLTGLGMVIVPRTVTVGQIDTALDEDAQPTGEGGAALDRAFPAFADELEWWCEAAKLRRDSK